MENSNTVTQKDIYNLLNMCQQPLWLVGANLDGLDLRYAKLHDANLAGASLVGTNLEGAYLWDANLQGADLRRANLERAYLRGANLMEANLGGTSLKRANLCGTDFYDAQLLSDYSNGVSEFSGPEIELAAKFLYAEYDNQTRWPGRFDPAGFNLNIVEHNQNYKSNNRLSKREIYLLLNTARPPIWLEGINLEGFDLSGAKLHGAILRNANLRCAVLNETDLSSADLRGANLYSASMYQANLEGADMRNADLVAANLVEANLCGANLMGAQLEGDYPEEGPGAKIICSLSCAKFNKQTIWPKDYNPNEYNDLWFIDEDADQLD